MDLDESTLLEPGLATLSSLSTPARNREPKKIGQFERMDVNVETGKTSLFISNLDEHCLDINGHPIITDQGNSLIVNFRKDSLIGAGRYSKVFKGVLNIDDKWVPVAVKVALNDPESKEALLHEASFLSKLKSNHIVKMYGSFSLEGNKEFSGAIILELGAFGTLHSFLQAKEQFSLSLAQFKSWTLQLFLALRDLRDAKLIHFDIKPQNILIMDDYTLRLADFGECMESKDLDYSQTRGRGTLTYSAPELLSTSNTGPCSETNCDLYSAGVVLYHMLTGREPWQDGSKQATHQILAIKKGFTVAGLNPIKRVDTSGSIKLLGPNGELVNSVESNRLVDLIVSCTRLEPAKRISLDEIISLIKQ